MGGNNRTHSSTCFDILTPAEPIEKSGICPVCQIVLGVQRELRNTEGDVNGTKWSEERKWFSGRTWIEVIEAPAEIEEALQVDGGADRRLSRRWWDDPIELAMKATRRAECQERADPIDFAMHVTRRVERAQRSSEIEEMDQLVKKKSWTDGVTWNPRQSLDTLRYNLTNWVEERRDRGIVDKRDKSPASFRKSKESIRKSKESSRRSVARKSVKSWVSGMTRISVLSRSQSRARTASREPAEKLGSVEEIRSAGAPCSPSGTVGIVDRRKVKVKMKWWRRISESWSRRKSRAGIDA